MIDKRIRPSEGRIGAYYRLKACGLSDTVIAEEVFFMSTETFNRWKRERGIKAGMVSRFTLAKRREQAGG